jgi:hypothetical protein
MLKKTLPALLLTVGLVGLSGCATRAQTGALIGSAAGAAGGYMIGNEMDKSDDRDRYHRDHHRRW